MIFRAAVVVWLGCVLILGVVVLLARLIPGAGEFVFVSTRDGGFQVFLHDVATGSDYNLSRGYSRSDTRPCWTPDGRSLVVVIDSRIVMMDENGAHRRLLSGNGENIVQPNCSPGSSTVTFTDMQDELPVVYRLDSTQDRLVELPHTEAAFLDSPPVLAPDGSRTLYIADALGAARHLRVQWLDSGASTEIYRSSTPISSPIWSPDMTHIAFESVGNLWVIDANGGHPVDLTRVIQSSVGELTWSPDGTRIAYTIYGGGLSNVLVSTIATGTMVNLTTDYDLCYDPHWAPDSRRLLVTCQDTQIFDMDIYMADVTARTMTRITFSPGRDISPAWQP